MSARRLTRAPTYRIPIESDEPSVAVEAILNLPLFS